MPLIAEVSPAAVLGRWIIVAILFVIAGALKARFPRAWQAMLKFGRGIGWTAIVIFVLMLLVLAVSLLL